MITTAIAPKQTYIAPFRPLSWQVAPWRDKSAVMLLTGSAGGGKSRLAAEKLHAACLKYPGVMALAVRKTRESMTNSTVLFMERSVIGRDLAVRHIAQKHRFEYANGSILAYGGMKDDEQREQIRSIGAEGGVDFLWMEEGVQFTEDDFNELRARVRGKRAGWRQTVLTTNPDAPTHWIYRRLIQGGEAKVYYSGAVDNSYNPADYVATLASLTGVLGDRLRGGQWVQATGAVYGDVWADGPSDGNVTEAAEYVPNGGGVVWFVDDGYAGELDAKTKEYTPMSHPRVFLLCQLRSDGRLAVFAESYAIKKLADVHLQEVQALGYPAPDWTAVDKSAAELRGRIHNLGTYTRQGPASVDESIKVARDWIAPDANGVRKVLVHPRCKHLRAEMASYRYDENTGKPIKEMDHGPDALRYGLWALRHEQ